MSDSINREALLKEFDDYNQGNALAAVWRLRQIITNAPAIEQGEAFGYVTTTDKVMFFKQEFEGVIYKNWHFTRSPVYTTPQQPQSVADALEEAAKIMRTTLTGRCWETDIQMAEQAIRALIKRNAKAVE